MTDNRTNEQIVAKAMVDAGAPLMHSRVEEAVVGALRSAGRIVGEPTEAQIEAAAKIIRRASLETTADPGDFWSDCHESERERWRGAARAAIEVAGLLAKPSISQGNEGETAVGLHFSEEQVEAAAREWYEQANGYETWASAPGKHQQVVKVRAAKALTAAVNTAPQAPYSDPVMTAPQTESDEKSILAGILAPYTLDHEEQHEAAQRVLDSGFRLAPVLPSSTVDEGRISEAIEDAIIDNLHPENTTNGFYVPFTRVGDIASVAARAVAEAVGGEGL